AESVFYDLPIMLRTRPYWEFQFVGPRNVPLFDENFPYRYRNNLQLRWELCRARYRLTAVHDLFVYHTLDARTDKDDPTNKRNIKAENKPKYYRALRLFNNRMNVLYPKTGARCPLLTTRSN
ncbi:hypothetical protein PFISCL1PPCAC_14305, partial [Pristionchus fissidentatus]